MIYGIVGALRTPPNDRVAVLLQKLEKWKNEQGGIYNDYSQVVSAIREFGFWHLLFFDDHCGDTRRVIRLTSPGFDRSPQRL